MSKDSEVDQVGCVAGSQPKLLAIRRADGTYQVRDGVTMPKLASIDLDIDPALLEPSPRPRVLSVIDAALARVRES